MPDNLSRKTNTRTPVRAVRDAADDRRDAGVDLPGGRDELEVLAREGAHVEALSGQGRHGLEHLEVEDQGAVAQGVRQVAVLRGPLAGEGRGEHAEGQAAPGEGRGVVEPVAVRLAVRRPLDHLAVTGVPVQGAALGGARARGRPRRAVRVVPLRGRARGGGAADGGPRAVPGRPGCRDAPAGRVLGARALEGGARLEPALREVSSVHRPRCENATR